MPIAVVTSLMSAALLDSGDPVPFAPAETRLMDWLGLTVYVVLVVAVCFVSVRMARAPDPTGGNAQPEESGPGTPTL